MQYQIEIRVVCWFRTTVSAMDLLLIFLFTVSSGVTGDSSVVNMELMNGVDPMGNQGYAVHEQLSERKLEGHPHFVTTKVHKQLLDSQGNEDVNLYHEKQETRKSISSNVGSFESVGGSTISMGGHGDGSTISMGGYGDGSTNSMGGRGDGSTITMGGHGDASTISMEGYRDGSTISVGGHGGASTISMGGYGDGAPVSVGGHDDGSTISMGGHRDGSTISMVGYGYGSTIIMGGHGDESTISMGHGDGKEIVETSNLNADSHSISGNTILSKSPQMFVNDVTYTHKPILLRSLSLNDNIGDRPGKTTFSEHGSVSSVQPEINRGQLYLKSSNLPIMENKNIVSTRKEYKEIHRKPYQSAPGSEENMVNTHEGGSPEQRSQKETYNVYTTASPEIPMDHSVSSLSSKHILSRDSREYSRNAENNYDLEQNGYSGGHQLSGAYQGFFGNSATGEGIGLNHPNPDYVLNEDLYGRYPSVSGVFSGYRSEIPHPIIRNSINTNRFRETTYPINHQPVLHHLEHSFLQQARGDAAPPELRSELSFNSGNHNNNFYLPLNPEGGSFSFNGFPFMRSFPSIPSYPSESVSDPTVDYIDG